MNGMLNDGVNSLSRYYINNFKGTFPAVFITFVDDLRQVSINILLGKVQEEIEDQSYFSDNGTSLWVR